MTPTRAQHRQRQILLVLLLFLVGQFALALHSHEHSLQSNSAEECVVCLVTSSDDSAAITETAQFDFLFANYQYLPAIEYLAGQARQTSSQPRAPPFS